MRTPEEDRVEIESLKNMLVSFATGGQGDDAEYRRLRIDLLRDPALRKELPRFIQTCRNLSEFWGYIKDKFAHYQQRREFLREEFDPILTRLESLQWGEANDEDTADAPHVKAPSPAPERVNFQDDRHEGSYEWDAFICHASEDKAFVSQLAIELRKEFSVWYDAFTLKVGDRLRRKIDEGLAKSRYGIVVLSENFFNKHWPEEELDGLAQRETDGRKVILPIWLGVGYKEVRGYSVTLADRVAARGDDGLPEVVRQISEVLREGKPNESHSRQGQQSAASRLTQTEQGDDPVWAALASAMEAGKRPVVGAGMMKISVPGVVQELVVDAAMLVEALKDGPLSREQIDATSGGVYENLGVAIPDAERQGLVMEEPFASGGRIMLTAKGRLLVRILEEDKRLSESPPSHAAAVPGNATGGQPTRPARTAVDWSEERDRPRYEVTLASVKRLESSFVPQFNVKQFSGDPMASLEWRFRGPRFPMEWRQASGSALNRTHFLNEFDLSKPPRVDDLVGHDELGFEIRFHWRGRWRSDIHRWPMTRRDTGTKVLWDLGSELLPPIETDEAQSPP